MLNDWGERGKDSTKAILAYFNGEPYRRRIGTGEYVAMVACTLYTVLMACAGLWWLVLRFIVK